MKSFLVIVLSEPNSSGLCNFVLNFLVRYIFRTSFFEMYVARETALISTLLTVRYGCQSLLGRGAVLLGSLPAKVSTRVTKRKMRREVGPLGTRVGSICSLDVAAPRATPATRRSPPSLLADVHPWNLLFLALSPRHPRDADALHPPTSKRHDESTHADSHPVSLLPHPRMLRMSTLSPTHPFFFRNN